MASPQENRRWYEQGLKWKGRKNGVSEWRGTWRNGPPIWFCRLFTGLSVLLGIIALGGGIVSLFGAKRGWAVAFGLGLEAIMFGIVSWFCYRQRDQLLKLRDTAGLAEAMGISQEELERKVEERDLKPDIYFNGIPLYNPDKLIAAKILLRPSSEPVNNETLLRAASPNSSATETDQLLRASTGE